MATLAKVRWHVDLIDDEAATVIGKIREPLLKRGISLAVFEHPDKCLNSIAKRPTAADLLISDLSFPNTISDADRGASLPYRYMRMAKRAKWTTIPTVLTNYYEKYEQDIQNLHEQKGFCPTLIVSKSVLGDEKGAELYASFLEKLLKGEDISPNVARAGAFPSLVFSQIPRLANPDQGMERRALSTEIVLGQPGTQLAYPAILPHSLTAALFGGLASCSVSSNSTISFLAGASVAGLGVHYMLRYACVPKKKMTRRSP